MSDTPETDAAEYLISIGRIRGEWMVLSDFSRKLERERDELRAQLTAERALADRLGNALEKIPWTFVGREEQASEEWNAIAAWKEARSE